MVLRVLVAGLGNMGRSHALAYHRHPGFEIAGLVNRSTPRQLHDDLAGYDILPDYAAALRELKPDVVSINTYSEHACRLRPDGNGTGRACVRRKAAGDECKRTPSASSRRRRRTTASSWSATSSATTPAGCD